MGSTQTTEATFIKRLETEGNFEADTDRSSSTTANPPLIDVFVINNIQICHENIQQLKLAA